MTKAQSSLWTQIWTGHIGLREYLFARQVPGMLTPQCSYVGGGETPAHIHLDCSLCDRPSGLRSRRDLDDAITNPDEWCELVAWLMDSERLSEYTVARSLGANPALGGQASDNFSTLTLTFFALSILPTETPPGRVSPAKDPGHDEKFLPGMLVYARFFLLYS